MLLPIHLWPNPILRQRAAEVTEFGPELHELLKNMHQTMHVEDGVGLAAPQIGVSQRIAVLTDGKQSWDFINPTIVGECGCLEAKEERCLSLEGMSFKDVLRNHMVRVNYFDKNGVERLANFEWFLARAVQHEIDHLDGKLLIDKLLEQLKDRPWKAVEFEKRIRDAYAAKTKYRNLAQTR